MYCSFCSDCKLKRALTGVLGEAYRITFSSSLSGLSNPVDVAVPMPYEVCILYITV